MGMKFLNKKGWHTGSLRNIERVWVAEEKEKDEQRKIQELKKQQDEEREKAAFRKLQEDAGLKPRQERLDFLYESGLAVGKGSSEGFQALQQSVPAAAASSSAPSTAGSSKAAAPGALFEDKPQSANDTWRKLHSDPLLLIRQREQDAIARIKNNPIKMAEIKKSVEAEKKQKEEKKEKKKHKKHHHHKSKSKRRHSNENSDSEEISDDMVERKKSVHSFSEHKREEKRSRRHEMPNDDEPRKSRKEKKGQREDSEDDEPKKPRKDQKDRRQDSEDDKLRRRRQMSEDDEPKRKQSDISGDDEPRRRQSKHHEHPRRDHSDADDRKGRQYAPSERNRAYSKHDSSDSRQRRTDYGRGNSASEHRSNSELGSEGQRRLESQQGRNGPTFNRRRGVHHMSAEEREARLRQMEADAEVHEEQRWSRIKKAADDDAKEAASVNANQFRGKNFLEEEKKSIFGAEKGGSATIEESIRRRAYYSQGGRDAEGNAFRR
ncbi:hypothetical protein ABZP36_027217 [Zizania latifolia]